MLPRMGSRPVDMATERPSDDSREQLVERGARMNLPMRDQREVRK